MKINELLDRTYNYQEQPPRGTAGKRQITYSFDTDDGLDYEVQMFEQGSHGWDINFWADGGAVGVIGTGDAFRVFSTVIAIIKEAVEKYNMDNLLFSADEPSRVKLYKKLSGRVARELGWKVSVAPLDDHAFFSISRSGRIETSHQQSLVLFPIYKFSRACRTAIFL